jgi:FkbM family methyltransferase
VTLRRQLARIGPLRDAVRRVRRGYRTEINGEGPLEGMRLRVPWELKAAYAGGKYEQDVAAALERLVRPGWACADVGAHIGYFTLALARLVGETGRVISFEASPANEKALEANIALNRLEGRVESRLAAVVEQSHGTVPLYPGRSGSAEWTTSSEWTTSLDFASRKDEQPTSREPLMVPTVALDDVFPAGTQLQLVKMDIEGAEARALRGMARILREMKPIIVLEFHGEVGWPGVIELVKAGYTFEDLSGDPLPTPREWTEVPYQSIARVTT